MTNQYPQRNAAPAFIPLGQTDASAGRAEPSVPLLPSHLPWCPILSSRGDGLPHVVDFTTAKQLFGSDTFDESSNYFTPMTKAVMTHFQEGNVVMLQRLIPELATKANLRLWVEIIDNQMVEWERQPSGQFALDYQENRVVAENTNPFVGKRLVWHVTPIGYETNTPFEATAETYGSFGEGNVITNFRDGSVMDTYGRYHLGSSPVNGNTYSKSQVYPIMDFEVSTPGFYGNAIGIRIVPLGLADIRESLYTNIKATAIRIEVQTVDTSNGLRSPWYTTRGAIGVNGFLAEEAFDIKMQRNVSMKDIFLPSYTRQQASSSELTDVPFGAYHIYHDNIETVQWMIKMGHPTSSVDLQVPRKGEAQFDMIAEEYGRTTNWAISDGTNHKYINIFTGKDQKGVPYFSFETEYSDAFGGVNLNNNALLLASGGDDGLNDRFVSMNVGNTPTNPYALRTYWHDTLARREFERFGDGPAKLLNSLRYPLGVVYDLGYTLKTKEALASLLGKRKDLIVILSTYSTIEVSTTTSNDDGGGGFAQIIENGVSIMPPLEADQERSLATAIQNIASSYIESETSGTRACRYAIVMQEGKLIGDERLRTYPQTLDLLAKLSRYMGAGTGNWNATQSPDVSPNNIVDKLYDLNHTYFKPEDYADLWDQGLIWSQSFDQYRLFYPAMQTGYPDDTSVLNNLLYQFCAVDVTKMAETVWRDLVGNTLLSREERLARSNELLLTRCSPTKYNNRYRIEPESYYTAEDQDKGWSAHVRVKIYGPTMTTVDILEIVAYRSTDAQATV